MRQPVTAEDGRIYERSSIEQWIERHRPEIISPRTRDPMGENLLPNETLHREIEKFLEELSASSATGSGETRIESVASLNRLFERLDELADLSHELLDDWPAPSVVVLGKENTGKSTLLERLLYRPLFPHDKRVCTRMAVRVSVRRTPVAQPVTLEVWDTQANMRIGPVRTIQLSTGHVDIRKAMEDVRTCRPILSPQTAQRHVVRDSFARDPHPF